MFTKWPVFIKATLRLAGLVYSLDGYLSVRPSRAGREGGVECPAAQRCYLFAPFVSCPSIGWLARVPRPSTDCWPSLIGLVSRSIYANLVESTRGEARRGEAARMV